ncbi:hypothetical protein D4764_08G0003390 [Takifugu flavidus]|uniref:Reverse transcriptase domain-containing protein n=1 Tax=Takifugu flavidus TaxID=433684 RepID=A0A5C6MME5_9TELE|nr:hypothetical protein D4764_08G0003390 [Takifugu flavidus]
MGEEGVYSCFAKVLPHGAKTFEDVLACEISLPCGNSVALNQLPLAAVRFASRDHAEDVPKDWCHRGFTLESDLGLRLTGSQDTLDRGSMIDPVVIFSDLQLGITLLSLPGKIYSGVLERRVCRIVKPRIQEEQCGRGMVDQLYTLSRVFEEYGVSGPLIWAVHSLYDRCQSLVHIAGNDVVLLASSAFDLQRSLDRFAAACEAAGMRISTSKSEAMVLKKVECLLRVKEEILPQVEDFKYLGVLFTSEGRMEQEIDRPIVFVKECSPSVIQRSVRFRGSREPR